MRTTITRPLQSLNRYRRSSAHPWFQEHLG